MDERLRYDATTSVIIVPAGGPAALQQQQQQLSGICSKCGCCGAQRSSPCRAAGGVAAATGSNYLTRGGGRALDRELVQLNKAAFKDLQVANSTLAQELVRLQACGHEEKAALGDEVAKLQQLARAQQEKIDALKGRLAEALKKGEQVEARHAAKLKELARRLKEEQLAKLRPLQEAHEQLVVELAARQEGSRQLEQLREQLGKTAERLEVEAASRAELWQKSNALEQDLRAAQEQLGSTACRLKQAEHKLERAAEVEQWLAASEEALQAERVAHNKLQAEAALARSQGEALQAETERLRRELGALGRRAEQGDAERASLKLALADAQSATADARVEMRAAAAHAERLEQELELARRETQSQAASLRSQAAAREERLAAQAASRLAQLQSELDARGAALADTEAALSAARTEVSRLSGQVESLRHVGDVAGSQLASSQARINQLKQQVADLEAQLQQAQVSGLQRDAALSEALVSQRAGVSAWQEERQQLQDSAAKWRQKAVDLQAELEAKSEQALGTSQAHAHELAKLQVALDGTTSELADTRRRLAAVEEERTAAAKRSSQLLGQWEERDKGQVGDIAALRSQVADLLAASSSARAEADTYRQQLRLKEAEVEAVTMALAEEQARLAVLREQLGALGQEKAAEVEARLQSLQELSLALQVEQQARLDAQVELTQTKKKQATIESQLHQQRIQALTQALEAKGRAEEVANSAAALSAADRKAKQYRREASGSAALLGEYDDWVQGLLAKKAASAAGAADGGGGGDGGSAAAMVGVAARPSSAGLSRASPGRVSPGRSAPPLPALPSADLERLDHITALLEARGVGSARLARSLSARGPPPAASGAGAAARASAAAVSPRPLFKV